MSDDVADLLRSYPAELMTMHPVSNKVNSPKNEGRELIEPITLADDGTDEGGSGVPRANEAGFEPSDSE